jgi:glucose/arabinose dehydrogenase
MITRTLFSLAVVAMLSASAAAQRPSIVTPTEPVQLVETELRIPQQFRDDYPDQSFKLWMPPGFNATLYYESLDLDAGYSTGRMLALDSNGVIHFADLFFSDIRAFKDFDKDGLADTILPVTPRLDSCHGLAFYKGALYASQPTKIRKLLDKDGDGFYETEEPFITGLPSYGDFNHWTRTFIFDEVKKKLYVTVGTSCDACRITNDSGEPDPWRAVILEFNDDGTGKRIYASGLRNVLGLAIDPKTRKLWATNADRNKLGDDYPEEILSSIRDGGFYGYPIAYGNRDWTDFHAFPEYTTMLPITKEDTAMVEKMEIADYFLAAHSTPFGVHFYQGKQFPEAYRTGYVAIKGSSDSKVPHGYRVQRFWEENGERKIADFIVGFSQDSLTYKIWGRPSSMVEDRDGNLYIMLEHLRSILKVSYDPSSVQSNNAPAQRALFSERHGDRNVLSAPSLHTERAVLDVYTITGQSIFSSEISDSSPDSGLQYALPSLSAGVYLCRIAAGGEMISGSVLVK